MSPIGRVSRLPNTARDSALLNSVRSGRTWLLVMNDCCTCCGPRKGVLPGRVSTWISPYVSGALDAETNADRFSRRNALSALVSWKLASGSPGRWARM